MLTSRFIIANTHPCIADHFPGYPIAPGVLTLDQVSRGLLEQLPGYRVSGFPQVKFLQPVLPEQKITVSYICKKEGLYQFRCMCGEQLLVSGQVCVQTGGATLG